MMTYNLHNLFRPLRRGYSTSQIRQKFMVWNTNVARQSICQDCAAEPAILISTYTQDSWLRHLYVTPVETTRPTFTSLRDAKDLQMLGLRQKQRFRIFSGEPSTYITDITSIRRRKTVHYNWLASFILTSLIDLPKKLL